ncbi:MAG: GGDEF domain-containing protein [Acidimicrobiia bacterium]|nr:GGDEF domain-containing protein [Acidimicrobiia bacterium]
MCVVLVSLLAAFAALIHKSDEAGRRALSDRFHTRATLTGSFARDFVDDLAMRERRQSVNDANGQDAGDRVLQATAAALVEATRSEDIAGRWGGEEFLVLLPHTGRVEALVVAERIRELIARTVLSGGTTGATVTTSIGVAVYDGGETLAFLRQADAALYIAKASGRNRVELWNAPAPSAAA